VLAIGLALVAMWALALALDALRSGGAGTGSSSPLLVAGENAGVGFYLSQSVGVSFFNHTGEMRFAALPGLALIGLSIVAATALAVRLTPGSQRRSVRLALLVAAVYALIAGLGALLVPLHVTARGFAADVAVHPSLLEAFLLPFCWALLFSSLGALVGLFGRRWRHEASRLLGAWATPLNCSLRGLAAGLAVSFLVTIAGGLALAGEQVRTFALGSVGQFVETLLAAVLLLPTAIAAVLLGSFGVSGGWRMDALSHGEGSLSVFGGALPGAGSDPSGNLPGALALLPLVGFATVFVVGWLTARGSGEDVKRSLGNSLRAGALLTAILWLVGLLARVDAQAGGLLGFHFAPDATSLLWLVPLWSFLGCLLGASAWVLTRGPESRRQFAAALTGALVLPPPGSSGPDQWGPPSQGILRRASAGFAFALVPLALLVVGPAGGSPPEPGKISYAPIAKDAERQLEGDSAAPGAVAVTVNPVTRTIGTASVRIPVEAVDATPGEAPATKARAVLAEYGDLFGLTPRPAELGRSEAATDQLGMSHVSFEQMAGGVPVFGSRISVHFSPNGKFVTYLSGSVAPGVNVAETDAKLDRDAALARADKALPSGQLVKAPTLQVYAGSGPVVSGPEARLAWFVWLIDNRRQVSNEYVIDAVDGRVLKVFSKNEQARNRLVYNANNGGALPGTLVRSEGGGATGNKDVDNAYNYSGDTYDMYAQWFGRDSYDAKGATLKSSAHYLNGYENAFWNGIQMVYGDGFASARDVVGHELTHAVTEYTSGLVYEWQSGALNEAFSDVMGETVEWFKNGSVDWLMGADLPIGAIRSLKEPNEYEVLGGPSPKQMSEWYAGCEDNFGVHVNSTIVGHAYYLLATQVGVPTAAQIFYRGFTVYLGPNSTMEDARSATIQAAIDLYGNGSTQHNKTASAFNSVGLNGTNQPPAPNCAIIFNCSFGVALEAAGAGEDEEGLSPASMLATLYKARGELAQGSAAGNHFLPLYEEHMGRISELVSDDPELAEMAVVGLEELTPALEGLIEGEGEQFDLPLSQMAKIEAALERLAQDDRLYGGPDAGELADLIDDELEWMGLPSYGGMNYESGFNRLNEEVKAHTLMEETGVIKDPNCLGQPYSNDFHFNGFYVDTPGHRIAGQVAPLVTGGVICGAEVEATSGTTGCVGEETLNTAAMAQLPPGDKVKSSKSLPNRSWVGEAIGRSIVCAGDETKIIYGQAGLLSMQSWESWQCPTAAIACYEGRSNYEASTPFGPTTITGSTYASVTEEGGELTMTTRPVEFSAPEGYVIKASFGQLEVKLCSRAGGVEAEGCGGPSAPWIHQNGEAGEVGCPDGKGRFTARAENLAGQETLPVSSCVRWEQGAQMQTVGAPNGLQAVSCVPGTTTCVAADSKGNAFYATNVSAGSPASWTSWSGPGTSPAHAVECPATTLCLLAAGSVSGGGGNLYRSSSLGGSFLTSFSPANGVGAISCPSSSFCVSAQMGGGFIRYSTNPSGVIWKALEIGSGAMNDVSCLSASFCAVVDGTGSVHVATTEKGVKEAPGWAASNVNGTTALDAIACSSTTSCLALDGSGEVLRLAISQPSGEATVTRQALDGAADLTEVTCTGSDCVAVDDDGGVFASEDAGASWAKRFATAGEITSLSCASGALCASVDASGDVAMFDPQ
jgi:Zn-dependent metalloprotease